MPLVVATWNVNSIKARLPIVSDWLKDTAPDVLVMQEIKCETAAFPAAAFEELGYHVTAVGQKAYNGVALLSKAPHSITQTRLSGDDGDEQARYVEADVAGVCIGGLYLPNGNPVDTPKFDYKLRWMDRLTDHVRGLLAAEVPFVLGGDWNVIPEARDVFDPRAFANDALFRPETLARWRTLLNLGLTDAFRALHPAEQRAYTFWDYQAGCWPRDAGLRIDHFLLAPQTADRLSACTIDRSPRALYKASDHTPVVMELL